jgi:hypothetical protein
MSLVIDLTAHSDVEQCGEWPAISGAKGLLYFSSYGTLLDGPKMSLNGRGLSQDTV